MKGRSIFSPNRWMTLGTSVLISSCCGVNYAWGIYSSTLKSRLEYSQATLITLSFWGNVGQFFTPPAGIVYDAVGSRGTLFTGLILATTGYTLMYLGVSGQIDASFNLLCVFYCLGSAMQPFYDTASLFTNTSNFPADVNSIIGYTKAWNGIGASLFSTAYIGYIQPNNLTFLKLIPVVLAVVGAVGLPTTQIDRIHKDDVNTGSFIQKLLGSQMLLVLAVAAFALVNANFSISQGVLALLATIIMVIISCFVVLPASIVGSATSGLFLTSLPEGLSAVSVYTASHDCQSDDQVDDADPLLLSQRGGDNAALNVVVDEDGDDVWYSSLITIDFWIIFVVLAVAAGSGLTVINNIAQILSSKNTHDGVVTASTDSASFVALLSASNCAGRIIVGYVCDRTGKRLSIVVAGFMIMLAVQSAAIMILSSLNSSFAYVACILSGLAYGALWALVPTATRLLWAPKRFATNYNFLSIGTILGNYVLSVKVTAEHYDNQLLPGDYICKKGSACFESALHIVAISCAVAMLFPPIVLRKYKFGNPADNQLVPPSPSQL
eukprot:TRINITY_DN1916_c0_g2_i3.p1 TRINITY_DN1916_c0_g2~~TRINITY_DN1916_c0_g2_i3.p1  ORF type:complete len:570 (+),score=55.50 TRINITY_DN1916_c0_g2_i3:59-1711(+)